MLWWFVLPLKYEPWLDGLLGIGLNFQGLCKIKGSFPAKSTIEGSFCRSSDGKNYFS
jgi:hypothetical protein